MGHIAVELRMSAEEFLEWDRKQTLRHEFLAGEIFAMTGGTDRHATAIGNLYVALRNHLRGTSCRVYSNDVKLGVERADAYFYPDLMVTCGARDAASRLIKREAKFVAEVLSKSTSSYDRGHKFAAYRALPTLEEYLLVDLSHGACDLFRKGADGLWVLYPAAAGGSLHLASIDMTLALDDLFADLEPDSGEEADEA